MASERMGVPFLGGEILRVMVGSILVMLFCFLPTNDAQSASRIRLPEVVELSQTILKGEILEVERLSSVEAESGAEEIEQRFKIRVTRFLRGEHRLDSLVTSDGTLWLSRTVFKSPRRTQRLRRSFATPFKADTGVEGVFFLQGASHVKDAENKRTYVRFDWVGDPSKLRKLGSVLRKVSKAEGLRVRANGTCRYATYEVAGKCLSASDAFAVYKRHCPQGTKLHDFKHRDFGLKLACKKVRGLVPHGPTVLWTEYGKLESKTMMAEGRPHGMMIRYGLDGKKRSGTEYVEGREQGRIVSWHPNGRIKTEGSAVNGLLDGEFRQYSQSGQLLGTYVMTQGTGTLKKWREDGTLQSEAVYTAGKSNGLRRQWYSNGQKMSEGEMTGGKMNGLWVFYGATGTIDSSVCYEASPERHSKQLWRRKKVADLSCPPGPNTAQAE